MICFLCLQSGKEVIQGTAELETIVVTFKSPLSPNMLPSLLCCNHGGNYLCTSLDMREFSSLYGLQALYDAHCAHETMSRLKIPPNCVCVLFAFLIRIVPVLDSD